MLLPMHLPVLLCGLICGWQYGGVVGFVLPLLRYVMFGMPPIFPTGLAMAFEMAAYGMFSPVRFTSTPSGSAWWRCTAPCLSPWWAAASSGAR